jgi:hypothetical protein
MPSDILMREGPGQDRFHDGVLKPVLGQTPEQVNILSKALYFSAAMVTFLAITPISGRGLSCGNTPTKSKTIF